MCSMNGASLFSTKTTRRRWSKTYRPFDVLRCNIFFNRDQSCPRNKFAYRSLEKPVFKKMDIYIYIYLREDAQLLSPLIIYRAVSSTKKDRLPPGRLPRLFNNT